MSLKHALALALALPVVTLAGCSSLPGNRDDTQNDPGLAGAAGAGPAFGSADQNGSGTIEQNEAAVIPGLDFASADVNHDGKLSQSEYEAAMHRRGPAQTGRSTGGGISGGATAPTR